MKYNSSYMIRYRLLVPGVDLCVYVNGRMKLPDHDQSFRPELQYAGFQATRLIDCHLIAEYMVHSREVKWNGWCGTWFLKHKKQHMNVNTGVQCLVQPLLK
jgi:hypothetical protein